MTIPTQLAKIEKLRIAYTDGTFRNLMPKEIKSWKKLLKGDSSGLSSGRKSVLKRANEFAATVLENLGADVLLLVLSSMNRTELAAYPKKKQLLQELGKWWDKVSHPPALSNAAKCINDEEVVDEEVDAITPKIMEHGKSTSELQTCKKILLF
jgi:spermidine/putrescine-binding protein